MSRTVSDCMEDIRRCGIFSQLTNEETLMIVDLAEEHSIKENEVFITEGDLSHSVFIIKSGSAEVFKKSGDGTEHCLVVLNSRECIGEMSLVEIDSCRSASVRARGSAEIIKIDFDRVIHQEDFKPIHFKIISGIAEELSKRLRYTDDLTVQAMKKEIESNKARLAMGMFSINIMFLLAIYTLALRSLAGVVASMGNSTPITVGMAIIFAVVIFILIKKSGYPLSTFGLTLKNWKRVLLETAVYSIPAILLLVVIKLLFIKFLPEYRNDVLFNPMEALSLMGKFNPVVYIGFFLFYSAFAPVQEFIARTGIQAAFQNFLPESKGRKWISIFMANLLFSMAHSHISFFFAMIAFVPGLFWGWLFYRQKSLVGVALSHILIGDIALFLLGFKLLF